MWYGMAFLGFCLVLAAFIFVSVRLYQLRPEVVTRIIRYLVIAAFAFTFSFVAVVIGFYIGDRHNTYSGRHLKSVTEIWGGFIEQNPPSFYRKVTGKTEFINKQTGKTETQLKEVSQNAGFEVQDISVELKKNIRTKGLLEFPGFSMTYKSRYVVSNRDSKTDRYFFAFELPYNAGNITRVAVSLDGQPYSGDNNFADGIHWDGPLAPGEKKTFTISFDCQGTQNYTYALGSYTTDIRQFKMQLNTDYDNVLLPDKAIVPVEKEQGSEATRFAWQAENLITRQNVAVRIDIGKSAGEVISRLFMFAPVSILLFVAMVLVFSVAGGIRLHPMHYLFLLTGYFIFYLLSSYLVSYVDLWLAVLLSLGVSTGIMIYYTVLIKDILNIVPVTAGAAAVFQWIFSAAFFFPQHTGFIITVAAIIGFVALTRFTARVNWEDKW